MIENVIVTIIIKFNDFSVDMELPANINIDELKSILFSILNEKYEGKLKGHTLKSITFKDKVLPGNKTLGECAVWDGSILKLE